MFDHISGYYDGTNRILSFGLDEHWRRRAVSRLAPGPGRTYLDIGCGTGDIALEILKQCPESKVIGIDQSDGMLGVGRTKIRGAGLENAISLVLADVLDLRYEDNSFDGAITSFCIRNVTDRRRALNEIHRVVRPGGLLVILELTEPQGLFMKPMFKLYAKVVMPLVTKLLSSVSAYRYLADSMADFPSPQSVLDIMKETGFEDLKHGHMTGGIVTLFAGQVKS
ncbi:MAG: bifunctional demethylmenaquinone methyltransferase/2-methoxy-6-polyprenyl-1,4-benzoquinol methylase UbiE [Desulfomonile tiedjei]|nr:bifunctional demethylmenaquinone methyltransferase/2-methoxy-6-polyprenyl-1,4-benzoquinol methylase UbiE [Desulfomonile tiedjei]